LVFNGYFLVGNLTALWRICILSGNILIIMSLSKINFSRLTIYTINIFSNLVNNNNADLILTVMTSFHGVLAVNCLKKILSELICHSEWDVVNKLSHQEVWYCRKNLRHTLNYIKINLNWAVNMFYHLSKRQSCHCIKRLEQIKFLWFYKYQYCACSDSVRIRILVIHSVKTESWMDIIG
jgi:hypothetical protein